MRKRDEEDPRSSRINALTRILPTMSRDFPHQCHSVVSYEHVFLRPFVFVHLSLVLQEKMHRVIILSRGEEVSIRSSFFHSFLQS